MGRVKEQYLRDMELTYAEHLKAREDNMLPPHTIVGDYIIFDEDGQDEYDGTGDPAEAAAKQIGGKHYQMPIQPIDYIVKNDIPYREGNVIKYVTRHKEKNGKEDIEKAIHYLEMIKEDYV